MIRILMWTIEIYIPYAQTYLFSLMNSDGVVEICRRFYLLKKYTG